MIFDITGQRDRAVNEYNLAVRSKDNTQGAQEEAAKYLKKPYERKKTPKPSNRASKQPNISVRVRIRRGHAAPVVSTCGRHT
jgi:hypothetical protein